MDKFWDGVLYYFSRASVTYIQSGQWSSESEQQSETKKALIKKKKKRAEESMVWIVRKSLVDRWVGGWSGFLKKQEILLIRLWFKLEDICNEM